MTQHADKSITAFDFLAAICLMAALVFASVQFAMAKSYRSTQDFVEKAAVGGAFEIQSSKLALDRSQDPNVRQFAQQMVDDHTRGGDELQSMMAATNIDTSKVSEGLDSDHQEMLDALKSASNTDFDKKYIQEQKKAHEEAVSLFKDYVKSGDDAGMKKFAAETLPVLEQHQDIVKNLKPAKEKQS